MRKRFVALSLVSGVVALSCIAMPVSADDGEDHTTDTTTQESTEQTSQPKRQGAERKSERLTAAKQRVCEQREATINAIMDRRAAQATKHLGVFTKIYDRTKAFYEAKGKVAADYDALIAKTDAAKVKAEASIAALAQSSDFSCDDADPKAVTDAFKTAHTAVREDLKAYRTAIKNLIVAVKQAQGGLE